MPQFAYHGRDAAQAPMNGVMEGLSTGQVASLLISMGITPVVIALHQPPKEASETLARLFGSKRINDTEVLMFARQMYTLMRAGVPILRSLQGLEESSSHKGMRALLRELRQSLDSGYELSHAMAKRGDVFDGFFVAMVRVGETTGQLTQVFLTLHEHMEFQRSMAEQIRSALRYPKFVMLAMVVAMVVINIFVIPAFAKVFENLKTELPLMTRVLLGTSKFVVAWWPALLAACAAGVLALRGFVGTAHGRLFWDRHKMSVPVAGKIVRKGALSRVCRSLSLVLRSGVPVLEGLQLAGEVAENAHIERAV